MKRLLCSLLFLIFFVPLCSFAIEIHDSPLVASDEPMPAKGVTNENFFYYTEFETKNWSGDLKAFSFNSGTGSFTGSDPFWSAAQKLGARDPDKRVVLSTLGETVFPFRETNIPLTLKNELVSDADFPASLTSAALISHVRGKSPEGLRKRPISKVAGESFENRLGDMVHSEPLIHRDILYVGANDGMLHAFDADTGEEVFAFIPSFTYPNLWYPTRMDYADHHRYFVDGPITLQSVTHEGKTREILVGGLGKGGKGYYAIQVKTASGWKIEKNSSESELVSNLETWEFPPPLTRNFEMDMGFSFSKTAIVRSNVPGHPWIVVFGNGYNSLSGEAVLFILDAFTGKEIRRIRTGIAEDNGLSSPALVDTGNDAKADLVYAGDLRGNLWKFDISSENPENWEIFFDDNSTPKPLFTSTGKEGLPQAITGKPAIARHCSGTGYMVLWGTGKYLGLSDLADFNVQTFYGVWDYGGKNSNLGSFDRTNNTGSHYALDKKSPGETLFLVRQTIEAASFSMENALYGEVGENVSLSVASHTSHPQAWTWKEKGESLENGSTVGWFFDFPEKGERMVEDALVQGSAVIGISFVPACAAAPCAAGDESWINVLDLCTGSRLPGTFFDINGNRNLESAGLDGESRNHDSLVAYGTSYEVSRVGIPATTSLMGLSEDGFILLDPDKGELSSIITSGTEERILYWRMR